MKRFAIFILFLLAVGAAIFYFSGHKTEKNGDKIFVYWPKENSVIKSPVRVEGTARGTWFFEASFPVKIADSNGKILGQAPATFMPKSEEDTWMTENFIDFSGEIDFETPTTKTGYIIFEKDNPSGLPENDDSFKLPVRF